MPVPKPRGGESKSKFIGRCMSFMDGEGYEQDQAAAICYDKWRNKENQKMSKILDIYDDVQEGNPVRATSDGIAGVGDIGYDRPEGIIAGQYDEIEVSDEQDTPRSSDQDLDDLFPV